MSQVLTGKIAGITDLKRNPMWIADEVSEEAVAILNRNKPVFYCISPELLAYYQEIELERQLNTVADKRLQDLVPIAVAIDDL